MTSALTRFASAVVVAALPILAGCAAAATPSPRTVGLHIDNRIANAVIFSVGARWVGTPPPVSTYEQIVPACGGHLDTYVRASTPNAPSPLILSVDSSGSLDQELALASNNLDSVPSVALEKALLMWSNVAIDVESWLTITPDEVLQSTVAPAAPVGGTCAPWAYTPEPQ
jgi:hypothetical protein